MLEFVFFAASGATATHDNEAADDHGSADGLSDRDGFTSPQPRRNDRHNGTKILKHGRLSSSGMFDPIAPHRQREAGG